MPECDDTRPSEDPQCLWNSAVDAAQQAEGLREIVRRLAESCHDDSFELKYCFEALERLVAQLVEILQEQLCAGLLGPAAAADKAKKEVQP